MNSQPHSPQRVSTAQPTAPSTASRAPGPWIATLAAASALVASIPAQGLSVTIVENSPTRLVLDADWTQTVSPLTVHGVPPGGLLTVISGDPLRGDYERSGSLIFTEESLDGSQLYIRFAGVPANFGLGGGFPISTVEVVLSFGATSPTAFRTFDQFSYYLLTSSLQEFRLSGNPFGARWVLGTPLPAPDNGTTAAMMGTGLVGLALARRASSRRQKA